MSGLPGSAPHLAILCRSVAAGGSVANVAVNEARQLASRFRVTVISDEHLPDPPAGVKSIAAPVKSFPWMRRLAHVPDELSFCWGVRRALQQLHRRDPVDVVLCHSHSTAALVPWPGGRWRRAVVAMVTHGDIFLRPRGTYDNRLTFLYRRVTPRAYRRCDLVVTLSPAMRDAALRHGASPRRVRVIPNGVDLGEIGLRDPAPPREQGSIPPLRILYVGRFSTEKGVQVLIDACAKLHERGIRFVLEAVGDGPQLGECRERARQHGLEASTSFPGKLPRRSLGQHYRDAHVVCVPSLDEPLPTVALEALAAGTPVVGSATGGIPFLVHDGENGLLFPAGDRAALADCLARLALDPALTERMATVAPGSVLPRFSWPHVGEELASQIFAALSGKRRPTECGTGEASGRAIAGPLE